MYSLPIQFLQTAARSTYPSDLLEYLLSSILMYSYAVQTACRTRPPLFAVLHAWVPREEDRARSEGQFRPWPAV
jgi:hypothetical protein